MTVYLIRFATEYGCEFWRAEVDALCAMANDEPVFEQWSSDETVSVRSDLITLIGSVSRTPFVLHI